MNDEKKIEKKFDPTKINPTYTGPVDLNSEETEKQKDYFALRSLQERNPEWSRMGTLIRYAMEVWKMRLFGPGIMKTITKCWHAFITEREFDPSIIFEKLDSMPSKQFVLIELFEQKLVSALETYLAKRKTKK